MKPLDLRKTTLTGLLLGVMLLMVGCTATTRVNFKGPQGSVLFVDQKPYHLPATIDLTRPAGTSGSTRHDVSLAFTSATNQEVSAKGYLDAFAYTESDIDKISVNTCDLDETQLMKIPNGTTLIFKGQSASHQPIYELALSQK
jgi:hypothetical protein